MVPLQYIAMALGGVLFLGLFVYRAHLLRTERTRRGRDRGPDLPAEEYPLLRRDFFETPADQVESSASHGVYGVAMEIGFPPGVASVLAFADGTASLILETGGGILLAGERERVLVTARAVVDSAAEFAPHGVLIEGDPPLPRNREVRFHWLTEEGVRTGVASAYELEAQAHDWSWLYRDGLRLLDEIREAFSSGISPDLAERE